MSDLKFVGAPQKRKPAALLVGTALVVLVAAAFLLGRRAAAPENAPAATPAAPLSEPALAPATPLAEPTQPFRAAPTAPFLRDAPGARTSSEVFEVPRNPPPPPAAPAAAPLSSPEPVAPPPEQETLLKKMARCLSFTISQDSAFTVTSGVRLDITARNRCGATFNGGEARFEVRAVTANGTGVAGRERGTFQTTIPPYGSAQTLIVVPCDPDGRYRFEIEVI